MRKVEAATTLIARIVWYGGYTLLVYLVGAFVMGTSDVWEWSQGERGTIAWVWLIFGLISAGIGELQAIDSIRDGLIAMFSDDEEPTP
jgi:hypothetical protein